MFLLSNTGKRKRSKYFKGTCIIYLRRWLRKAIPARNRSMTKAGLVHFVRVKIPEAML